MRQRIVSLVIALIAFVIALSLIFPALTIRSQDTAPNADVAAYQLGIIAETKPGDDITYTITVTNQGPGVVESFYLVDGWTVNAANVSAFAEPIPDPNFDKFEVTGSWEQDRPDQKVFAWLLNGRLAPGDIIRFDWKVRVSPEYLGGLVNWARVETNGDLSGAWKPRQQTVKAPPKIASGIDPDDQNNRTVDGLTVVTNTPTGKGIDLVLYQAGTLAQIKAGQPLQSSLIVTNLGPQPVQRFYVEAAWSLNLDGSSILAQPIDDPDFGEFKVVGRWKQLKADEEVWLWLLEGNLDSGQSVFFAWSRNLTPTYRGDLINWARVSAQDTPEGDWTAREGTDGLPQNLEGTADSDPQNNRSTDALTTVVEATGS